MYLVADITCKTLAILFKFAFLIVVMRVAVSPVAHCDSVFTKGVIKLSEAILAPVRGILELAFGRFGLTFDLSYVAVIVITVVLVNVF